MKHTHSFNGPFSGTTRVGQYQKGKTNLDFTEARDSEWQWHQLGHMQICTSLQTDNHASTPPLSFLQAGCPSCRPTNSVKALKARLKDESSTEKYQVCVWKKLRHWLYKVSQVRVSKQQYQNVSKQFCQFCTKSVWDWVFCCILYSVSQQHARTHTHTHTQHLTALFRDDPDELVPER